MKLLVLGGFSFILLLLFCSAVFAYQRLCLSEGQSVPTQEDPRYTCHYDTCQICVTDDYYPTLPARCNHIESCQQLSSSPILSEDNSVAEGGINTIPEITPSPPPRQPEVRVSSTTESEETVKNDLEEEIVSSDENPVPAPTLPQQKNIPQNNNFFVFVSMGFTVFLTIILVGLLVINYRGELLVSKEKESS